MPHVPPSFSTLPQVTEPQGTLQAVPQDSYPEPAASTVPRTNPSAAPRLTARQVQHPSVLSQAPRGPKASSAQLTDGIASVDAAGRSHVDGAAATAEVVREDPGTNHAHSRDGAKILAASPCVPAQTLQEMLGVMSMFTPPSIFKSGIERAAIGQRCH
jgi:hypothetical protein